MKKLALALSLIMTVSVAFSQSQQRKSKQKTTVSRKNEKDKQTQFDKEQIEESVRKAKFEKTDEFRLNKTVKETFETWVKKGEFEKTDDFNLRIKENTKGQFEQIAVNAICNQLNEKREMKNSEGRKYLLCSLESYNADCEVYPIKVESNGIIGIDSLKISPKDASVFKEKFTNYKVSILNIDWVMCESYWVPKHISLVNDIDGKLLEISPFKNKTISDYATDLIRLGVDTTGFGNLHFSWLEYVGKTSKIEKEKMQAEQLEKQKFEREKIEKQKEEKQRIETERIEKEKAEKQRIEAEKEKAEKEKIEKEKAEKFELEQEQLEAQYEDLKASHTANYKKIYDRFSMSDLGGKKGLMLLDKYIKLCSIYADDNSSITLNDKVQHLSELKKVDVLLVDIKSKDLRTLVNKLDTTDNADEILKIILSKP